MEIVIHGEAKEIAALVLAVQERQVQIDDSPVSKALSHYQKKEPRLVQEHEKL